MYYIRVLTHVRARARASKFNSFFDILTISRVYLVRAMSCQSLRYCKLTVYYLYIYTYTHMRARVCMCVCVYIYVYVHIYIHIYIDVCICENAKEHSFFSENAVECRLYLYTYFIVRAHRSRRVENTGDD